MKNQLTENFSVSNQVKMDAQPRKTVGFDIIRFKHILGKSWILGLIGISSAFIIAFFLNRYKKPMYQSEAVIKLEFDQNAQELGLAKAGIQGKKQTIKNLSGEIELIKSNVLYDEVIKNIDLSISYFTKGKFLDDEKFSYSNLPFHIEFDTAGNNPIYDVDFNIHFENENFTIIYSQNEYDGVINLPITIQNFTFTVIKDPTDIKTHPIHYFKINSPSKLLSYLDKNLSIKILNVDAKTLGIYFKDENIFKAQSINKAIIKVYKNLSVLAKQKSNQQTLNFINQKLDSTSKQLENLESQMHDLSEGSMFGNTSESYGIINTQIETAKISKRELMDKIELLKHLNTIVSNDQDLHSSIPELEGLDNTSLSAAINELNQTNEEFNKLKESHKSSTLSYKNKEIERNSLRNTILRYIFENQKILFSKIGEMDLEIEELNQELRKLPTKESSMVRLTRNYNIAEQFYIQLNQKKIEFETTKAGKVPDFLVLSPPSSNLVPITASTIIVYISAIGIGLVFFILLFATLFFTENKILNHKELAQITNIPIIGAIPRFKKEKMIHSKLQVIDFPQSRISEAFRNIRSNLDFIINKSDSKIITISSTISGEGKTFITLNTAGILALSNKKVIVIDLDMRKAKLHHGFGVQNNKGMSDILAETIQVNDCINKSEFENLDFITAGIKPPNPSELILKPSFKQLLDDLKKSYDYIIIDTPPVGLVTDGVTAMSLADAQIYVTRANYTSINMIRDIEGIKQKKNFTNMSVVINDVSSKGGTYGYTGYGYGYGYYTED